MSKDLHIKKDKFQIITNKLSDAIMGYFMGMNPETVLDNVHACHSMLIDICNFYSGTAKPKGKKQALSEPSITINRPELFTEQLDKDGQKFFRRQKVDGKSGLYIDLGNAVKHADNDAEQATLILDQHAYEYLYALLRDYLTIRKALVDDNIVHKQNDLYTGSVPSSILTIPRRLTNAFLQATGNLQIPKFKPAEPFIDTTIRMFFNWAYLINKDMAKSGLDDKDPFWETVEGFPFEPFERQKLIYAMYEGTHEIGKENLRTSYLEAQGQIPLGSTDEMVEQNRRFLKEAMRKTSRPVVFDMLMKRRRQYTGTTESGYHFKKDEMPKWPFSEDVIVVDPAGFDHV